jgi:hypothetical protein
MLPRKRGDRHRVCEPRHIHLAMLDEDVARGVDRDEEVVLVRLHGAAPRRFDALQRRPGAGHVDRRHRDEDEQDHDPEAELRHDPRALNLLMHDSFDTHPTGTVTTIAV